MLPAALDGSPARAHVGGQTATFADAGDRVQRRLPVFVGVVVLLSFLLLTLVFRSLLVPLKAAAMNLLSIGAAYGVMVMVFQWGWGAGLIGLESTVPIVSFIPMFMFAILFGLSMDYEVFLLSRIREEYLAHRRQRRAVIRGIAGTGRVITSAALIMISVFLGFVVVRRPDHQDVRARPGDGHLRRRDAGADGAGAGDDDAARRPELVAARAGSTRSCPRATGPGTPRPPAVPAEVEIGREVDPAGPRTSASARSRA